MKIVNVLIPVSLQHKTSLTEFDLKSKLNNWSICWASTYFSGSFDNIEMAECDIDYNGGYRNNFRIIYSNDD